MAQPSPCPRSPRASSATWSTSRWERNQTALHSPKHPRRQLTRPGLAFPHPHTHLAFHTSTPPTQVVSNLVPASNYSVLLAVQSAQLLVETVTLISGILTPDTSAPTFVAVGPGGRQQLTAQSYSVTVPIKLDKPSTVTYALYR